MLWDRGFFREKNKVINIVRAVEIANILVYLRHKIGQRSQLSGEKEKSVIALSVNVSKNLSHWYLQMALFNFDKKDRPLSTQGLRCPFENI